MKIIGCTIRIETHGITLSNKHCDDCIMKDDTYECAYFRSKENATLIIQKEE